MLWHLCTYKKVCGRDETEALDKYYDAPQTQLRIQKADATNKGQNLRKTFANGKQGDETLPCDVLRNNLCVFKTCFCWYRTCFVSRLECFEH